jgi:hypothetical protein
MSEYRARDLATSSAAVFALLFSHTHTYTHTSIQNTRKQQPYRYTQFSKLIQYGSRFIKYNLLSADPKSEWGLRFAGLFAMTRDSRKVGRLFKTINEIQTVRNLIRKYNKADDSHALTSDATARFVLQVLGRIGMGTYWLFDNLNWASKAKFIKKNPDFAYYSSLGWWIGIVTSIADTLLALKAENAKRARAMKKLQALLDAANDGDAKAVDDNASELAAVKAQLKTLANVRFWLYLKIVGSLGDMATASNGWGFTERCLGYKFNDGIIGACGFVSGAVVCSRVAKDLLKKK